MSTSSRFVDSPGRFASRSRTGVLMGPTYTLDGVDSGDSFENAPHLRRREVVQLELRDNPDVCKMDLQFARAHGTAADQVTTFSTQCIAEGVQSVPHVQQGARGK